MLIIEKCSDLSYMAIFQVFNFPCLFQNEKKKLAKTFLNDIQSLILTRSTLFAQ